MWDLLLRKGTFKVSTDTHARKDRSFRLRNLREVMTKLMYEYRNTRVTEYVYSSNRNPVQTKSLDRFYDLSGMIIAH